MNRLSQSLEVDFYENPSIPKASAADVRQRLESNKNRQIEKQTRKTIKIIVCLKLQFPIETSAKQVQAENFAPSVENDLHRTNRTRTWKAEFGRKQEYQSCFRLSSCYFNDDIEVTEQEREKNNSM